MQAKKPTLKAWFKGGDPWIWVNAAAVSTSVIAVLGLLSILVVNGFGHFWPSDVMQAQHLASGAESPVIVIGEVVDSEQVSAQQLIASGIAVEDDKHLHERLLVKVGNRDLTGADFSWFLTSTLSRIEYPSNIMVLERHEWGNFYGRLLAIKETGVIVTDNPEKSWQEFEGRLQRAVALQEKIKHLEKIEVGRVNYALERLRLQERKLTLQIKSPGELEAALAELVVEKKALEVSYESIQAELASLYTAINRDSIDMQAMNGQQVEIPFAKIVRAYLPNSMSLWQKTGFYFEKIHEFLTDDPREANTEGGIFPAIFGTITMVLLMSIMVTPFGVIAAVYLREYATQGWITRTIRIAVNNLAGVPSIVYGVFGLGFFIYFLGEHIDKALFSESLPTPTFGTPGLMWASLTLALLTLPVVIVATEEGLSRIPRAVREGSLALGATKAETLWRIVLPMASPAIMTGLILAVARAAGEVAPLMLVGVVKLAPALPVDGNYPFVHLDQKFMHLGFHIYDVGFQSPNIEAARPLVYATALLLVIVIALLNFSAVTLRNHLREKYKSLEH